ncbi:MAG: response regulator [Desulfobacterium sp.]|jgi:DNA-binding NtrC family response regulator|nr:response regulator [Desulfobacterium sp.]
MSDTGFQKKLRIITMDDEEMIRDIVRAMLNKLGHETFPAKDGEEALGIYKKAMEDNAPIDLTIMDLTVPQGMGGKEAVQRLLKIDPKAKVVVFSGYSNDPVMADWKAYGFCAALEKPCRFEDFTDLMNRFVDKNSEHA